MRYVAESESILDYCCGKITKIPAGGPHLEYRFNGMSAPRQEKYHRSARLRDIATLNTIAILALLFADTSVLPLLKKLPAAGLLQIACAIAFSRASLL
jgi:hypothetical protein